MLAKDLLGQDDVFTTPKTDILDALYMMLKYRRRILPVLSNSKFAGLVTVASYVKVIPTLELKKPETILVEEIMQEQPFIAAPNTDAKHVVDSLCGKGVYGVPVVSGYSYQGIIRREEVIAKFLHLLKGRFKSQDVMSFNLGICSIHDTLESLIKRLSSGLERRIVVMNDDKIEGTITFEDMINLILADKSDLSRLSVASVLVPIHATVRRIDDASKAANLMHEWGINAVPVVDDGRLEGIIRDKDILQRIHSLI